jgi:hypothetical protein
MGRLRVEPERRDALCKDKLDVEFRIKDCILFVGAEVTAAPCRAVSASMRV